MENIDVINKIKSIQNWQGATGVLNFHNGIASPKVDLRMYHNGKWIKIGE